MFYNLCFGEKEWKLQPELILSPRCRNILYVCTMYKTMFKRIGEVYNQDSNPSGSTQYLLDMSLILSPSLLKYVM